jgi:hypothetical protein
MVNLRIAVAPWLRSAAICHERAQRAIDWRFEDARAQRAIDSQLAGSWP